MKHRFRQQRPPTSSPRLAVTITLTILAGVLAALTILTSDLASSAIPAQLKPYVPYSWPLLPVLLLLGIVVAVWQVWDSRNRSTNNGASIAQAAAQGNNALPIATPVTSSTPPVPGASSSQQASTPAVSASSQATGATMSTQQPTLPSAIPATPAATTLSQPAQHTPGSGTTPAATTPSQGSGATTPSQPTQHTPASGATPAPSVSPASIPTTAHYHTCVISYSDKNTLFVNKLYNDLKALGVPCLLVEQDLKIGDKLRKEIYQAIRQLDKLLLVLSQDAIESKWVEEAVDVALDRESQQPGTYLFFPLRLDDAVLTTEKYWAIAVRQRLIGDFRHWQQDAEYQQALQRVLRDLRV